VTARLYPYNHTKKRPPQKAKIKSKEPVNMKSKTQPHIYTLHIPNRLNLIRTMLLARAIIIQLAKPTSLIFEQGIRLAILHQLAMVHDDHLVEIENRVELMRDGDDGVGRELGAQEALDVFVGVGVQTVRGELVMG
jgi:hypothetical protein